MRHERLAHVAVAGHDVEHARRQPTASRRVGERERVERRLGRAA
jgi:hypothetical protein